MSAGKVTVSGSFEDGSSLEEVGHSVDTKLVNGTEAGECFKGNCGIQSFYFGSDFIFGDCAVCLAEVGMGCVNR